MPFSRAIRRKFWLANSGTPPSATALSSFARQIGGRGRGLDMPSNSESAVLRCMISSREAWQQRPGSECLARSTASGSIEQWPGRVPIYYYLVPLIHP
jgi:hypothetical protein